MLPIIGKHIDDDQSNLKLYHFSNCSSNILPICPDCDLIECIPRITAADCPDGTKWEDNIIWGCCPACTTRLDIGQCYAILYVYTIS